MSQQDAGEDNQLSREEQDAILKLQQDLLAAIARGDEPLALIDRLCLLEEQLVPGAVASAMRLSKHAGTLQVLAAPSIPDEAQARLQNLRPGPGAGSCGNAVFRGEPVFVANTFADPRWADLRSTAVDFNIRACWSMPIYGAGGKVIGSFALSSFAHREPGVFHRRLLEIGAHLIGILLERQA